MMSPGELAASLAEHRRRLVELFRNPRLDLLAERLGRDPPPRMSGLYALGDRLLREAAEYPVPGGPVCVQNFLPLTDAAVINCGRYGDRFLRFAVGQDGEPLLVSLTGSPFLAVDFDTRYDSGGTPDVEELPVRFDDLLAAVRRDP